MLHIQLGPGNVVSFPVTGSDKSCYLSVACFHAFEKVPASRLKYRNKEQRKKRLLIV